MQSGACERSGSIGTPVRGVENQFARTRLDFHNMQVSDNQHVEKVLDNLRQRLNLSEDAQVHEKISAPIWGLFMSTTMKASVHLGPKLH